MAGASRPFDSALSTSSLGVDASSVYRLLLDEHHAALSAARSALRRMRKHVSVRDQSGLLKLESLFSLVRASASYLGLSLLREVAYEAEGVVDRLKLPSSRQGPHALDALGEALDFVEEALQYARTQQRSKAHDAQATHIRDKLRALELIPSMLPDQLSDQELFVEDAERHLTLCREALVRGADNPADASESLDAAFRAMHTLKGNASMMGFAEIEALGRAAENTMEGLRSGELTLTSDLLLALLNLLEKAATAVKRPHDFQWLREAQSLDVACAEARIVARRTRLGALLVEHRLASREQVELVLAIKREPLGQALLLLNALSQSDLDKALDLQRKLRAGEDADVHTDSAPGAGSVQLDRAKIERLRRRVGRLRLLMGSLDAAQREALEELDDAAATLDRTPLRALLRRMDVLARELADRQHKRLSVRLVGEEIEVDRPLLSALSDALVHLIRNAVDHGLEHPIARVSAAKDELCNITLSARAAGNWLEVSVRDDGRGLSREAIVQRAVELSLLELDRAHALSDEEVFELVFSPGFSTADKLSEVSGRGVGLDAVKHTIEGLGGRVTIASQRGLGAQICLHLPQRAALASLRSPARDPFDSVLPKREKGRES